MDYERVRESFEILVQEIEKLIENINEDIKKSFESLNYIELEALSKNANLIKEFLKNIKKLQREWNKINSKLSAQRRLKKHKVIKERLKKGLRTPEKEYVKPILESLLEIGGKGKAEQVLKMVKDKMESILNKYDWEPLPSTPKTPRWKNTVQWARNNLVKGGYLSSNSPPGIWEITEKGKKLLETLT